MAYLLSRLPVASPGVRRECLGAQILITGLLLPSSIIHRNYVQIWPFLVMIRNNLRPCTHVGQVL